MERLIRLSALKKKYTVGKKKLTALDSLDLSIYKGETMALVGESGCGKSTAGKVALGLIEPTEGETYFKEKCLSALPKKELRMLRQEMQMVFQDPYASLNPRMTVEDILREPFAIHNIRVTTTKIRALAEQVGLNRTHLTRFPHEFSGGQRQRIGIARALALDPTFLVLDEPTSALDVSIQAQIINLLKTLQQERKLTYLFISHDLALVQYLADRVAVMYLGHLMEIAPSSSLYTHPLHPYTQALLSAIPIPDPDIEQKKIQVALKGEIPSPLEQIQGCPFAGRCPLASQICREKKPPLKQMNTHVHSVACHHVN